MFSVLEIELPQRLKFVTNHYRYIHNTHLKRKRQPPLNCKSSKGNCLNRFRLEEFFSQPLFKKYSKRGSSHHPRAPIFTPVAITSAADPHLAKESCRVSQNGWHTQMPTSKGGCQNISQHCETVKQNLMRAGPQFYALHYIV